MSESTVDSQALWARVKQRRKAREKYQKASAKREELETQLEALKKNYQTRQNKKQIENAIAELKQELEKAKQLETQSEQALRKLDQDSATPATSTQTPVPQTPRRSPRPPDAPFTPATPVVSTPRSQLTPTFGADRRKISKSSKNSREVHPSEVNPADVQLPASSKHISYITPVQKRPQRRSSASTMALDVSFLWPQSGSRRKIPKTTSITPSRGNDDFKINDQGEVVPPSTPTIDQLLRVDADPARALLENLRPWEMNEQTKEDLLKYLDIFNMEERVESVNSYIQTNRRFRKNAPFNTSDNSRPDFSVDTFYFQRFGQQSPMHHRLKSQRAAESPSDITNRRSPEIRPPDDSVVTQLIPVSSYNGTSYAFTPIVLAPQGDEFRQELPPAYGPVRRSGGTRVFGPLSHSAYRQLNTKRPGNSMGMVLAARHNFLRHVHLASTLQ